MRSGKDLTSGYGHVYAVHVPDAEGPVIRRGHYVVVILNERYCLDWAIASLKNADAFVAPNQTPEPGRCVRRVRAQRSAYPA
jgi:hypothetical protein